jgi:hypothetical protein
VTNFLCFREMQDVAKMNKIAAIEICCADLGAAVCGERHDCFEKASFVNTNFGLIAASMYEIAEERGFSAIANFYRVSGTKEQIFPYVYFHATLCGFLRVCDCLIVLLGYQVRCCGSLSQLNLVDNA